MAAIDLVRTATRVAMVAPLTASVRHDVVDLRAEPRVDSELVDQAHYGEEVRILGSSADWRYVQGEDHYLGWLPERTVPQPFVYGKGSRVVARLLIEVHEEPNSRSPVVAHLPVGTFLGSNEYVVQEGDRTRRIPAPDLGDWYQLTVIHRRSATGFVDSKALVAVGDLPHHYPTPDDYLKTAESFIGVPYLWGGTTALGLDCSGFVQQVYRLNGVALPRDADQQATLGRRVEEARAGDLMFFGAESVTHVGLATSASEFIHAPMKGGVVGHSRLGADRKLRGIRRYLPDVSTR